METSRAISTILGNLGKKYKKFLANPIFMSLLLNASAQLYTIGLILDSDVFSKRLVEKAVNRLICVQPDSTSLGSRKTKELSSAQ